MIRDLEAIAAASKGGASLTSIIQDLQVIQAATARRRERK